MAGWPVTRHLWKQNCTNISSKCIVFLFLLYILRMLLYVPLICICIFCCRHMLLKSRQFSLQWGSYSILFCSVKATCFSPHHHIEALVAMAVVAHKHSNIDELWRENGLRALYPVFVCFCFTNVAINHDVGEAGPRYWTMAKKYTISAAALCSYAPSL